MNSVGAIFCVVVAIELILGRMNGLPGVFKLVEPVISMIGSGSFLFMILS